jgi:tRNA G18 (ribose-2'-O)-methylase SpoU
MHRTETRRQRYDKKKQQAHIMPVSVCMVNFGIDENIALTIRAAACYGADTVMVIGSVPDASFLRPRSGTTVDYIDMIKFSSPHDFLEFARENDYHLVSAEICEGSIDINDYHFPMNKKTIIVMGNEYTGVPAEIIYNSDSVHITMRGPGFCLNTMQAGTVFLNEYSRQYLIHSKNNVLAA